MKDRMAVRRRLRVRAELPRSQQRLRAGPLRPAIDGFAAWLAIEGYACRSAAAKLRFVEDLSRWLEREELFDKPLVATFNREQASSDGGGVLLKAAERVYGLVKAFAGCLADKRAPEKVQHTLAELVGQRIFGIACGHPDGNDADHLAEDPIHKLLLGRDPVAGAPLASQPTIWTRPTTGRMARNSSRSSTGTTTVGAICRCSRS